MIFSKEEEKECVVRLHRGIFTDVTLLLYTACVEPVFLNTKFKGESLSGPNKVPWIVIGNHHFLLSMRYNEANRSELPLRSATTSSPGQIKW